MKKLILIIALTIHPLLVFADALQLSDVDIKKIESFTNEGDRLADKGKYKEAAEKYAKALDVLPAPINQWEACSSLLTAIGDMNFLLGSYQHAQKALSDAMHCPHANANPYIHLRLGQSQFELGDKKRAADELAQAYQGAGRDIFEPEDPKYFDFLKTVIKPPADGKW